MVINFDEIDEKVNHEFRGGKLDTLMRMHTDDYNKIMRGKLIPGASIGLHTHDTNCEIIYILSGIATCIYDDTIETLKEGECHYCPKGHAHSLINESNEDLIFFAVVPELKN